jgi:hypothetical protein
MHRNVTKLPDRQRRSENGLSWLEQRQTKVEKPARWQDYPMTWMDLKVCFSIA